MIPSDCGLLFSFSCSIVDVVIVVVVVGSVVDIVSCWDWMAR